MKIETDNGLYPIIPAGCDTIVATGKSTRDGVTLFGKNSDREPNEAHQVITIPAADHAKGSSVACTYIDIPQAAHTFAVLLAKPFWIWGAEMGVNEKGVAIGNEAVFTKVPYQKKPGLVGMDFLRLALERAASAEEAVKVIVGLLEKYGQGGNCGFDHKLYYHNSFLMADSTDAWVLETAGQVWAAKHIDGVYSISNGITIENDWDMASNDLVHFAVEKKWCKKTNDFGFSKCYSDFLYTRFSNCQKRRRRTMQLLSKSDKLSPAAMMDILRDHGGDKNYSPDRGLTGATVCMHAGFGPVRGSQTTGSLIAHLHPQHPTIFVTGTAAPCTSIFKPVWVDSQPATLSPTRGHYESSSLYWNHEVLHRHILKDYAAHIHTIRDEQYSMEQEFIRDALDMATHSREERNNFSAASFAKAASLEAAWLKKTSPPKSRQQFLHKLAWAQFNNKAHIKQE